MADQTPPRHPMQRKQIVAVNTDPTFLKLLRLLLEGESYTVTTTTDYTAATFDQIATLQPDLLTLDLAFGHPAGWELLERLHAEPITRRIPIVVTSTDPRLLERAAAHAGRYRSERFVAKPLDIDYLLAAIDELIGPA